MVINKWLHGLKKKLTFAASKGKLGKEGTHFVPSF
jgi:hypothetical protein